MSAASGCQGAALALQPAAAAAIGSLALPPGMAPSSSSASRCLLLELSDELLLHVMHGVALGDVRGLGFLRGTCRRLNRIAHDHTLLSRFHWPLVLAGAIRPATLQRPVLGTVAAVDDTSLYLSAACQLELWTAPRHADKTATARSTATTTGAAAAAAAASSPSATSAAAHDSAPNVAAAARAPAHRGPVASLLLHTAGSRPEAAMDTALDTGVTETEMDLDVVDVGVDLGSAVDMDMSDMGAPDSAAAAAAAAAESAAATRGGTPTLTMPTSVRDCSTTLAPPGKRPRLGSDPHHRSPSPSAAWLSAYATWPTTADDAAGAGAAAVPAEAEAEADVAAPPSPNPNAVLALPSAPSAADNELVQVQPVGHFVLALSALGTLKVWDTRTQECVCQRVALPGERRISFSLQGQILTLLSVVARPPLAYALMQTLSLQEPAAGAASPPGTPSLQLVPVNTSLLPLPSLAAQHCLMQRTAHGCSFTANAEAVPGTILVYPLHSREEEAVSKPLTRLVGHQHWVTDMAVHKNLLVSASNRDCVCLWDMAHAAFPCVAVVPMPVLSVAITSQRLYCVRGGSVLAWDLTRLKRGSMPFVGAMETDLSPEAALASRAASAAADLASRLAATAAASAARAAQPGLSEEERAQRQAVADTACRQANQAAATATVAAAAVPRPPSVVANDNLLCVIRSGTVKVWRAYERTVRA